MVRSGVGLPAGMGNRAASKIRHAELEELFCNKITQLEIIKISQANETH